MEPFIDLLHQLHRGIPGEFWPEMMREMRVYAQVERDGQGVLIRPTWPITIEGTVFDLEHPILVEQAGRRVLRLVDRQWERDDASPPLACVVIGQSSGAG